MVLEMLSEKPSKKNTKIMIILGLILYFFFMILMNYFYELSKYPVGFYESQLSFSGAIIKSHFRTMNTEQLNYYLIWTILDYGLMVGYGSLYFSLALTIARNFEENTSWRNSGYIVAIFGITAAICDGLENLFILLMLTDPQEFPDIWAIIHSCFALAKFILFGMVFIWIILALISLLVNKRSTKK